MNLNLTGKRALVTAASRGLGFATALGLAREGTALVICSRDEARINDAAQKIRSETGTRVEALVADVSSGEEAARLVGHAVSALGGLDIVVHNAGGPPAGEFLSLTDAQWQKAFDQNLMSLVRLVHAAVPELKEAGGRRVRCRYVPRSGSTPWRSDQITPTAHQHRLRKSRENPAAAYPTARAP